MREEAAKPAKEDEKASASRFLIKGEKLPTSRASTESRQTEQLPELRWASWCFRQFALIA